MSNHDDADDMHARIRWEIKHARMRDVVQWVLDSVYPCSSSGCEFHLGIKHSLGSNGWIEFVRAQMAEADNVKTGADMVSALKASLEVAEAGCICRAEERDSARAQAENFKRRLIEAEDQRAEMHRRMTQAECDRERTYQENRILTQLWCALRDKVKSLPKSDMTIGGWHDLQDFIKNQFHTDGLASNADFTGPTPGPAPEHGVAGSGANPC